MGRPSSLWSKREEVDGWRKAHAALSGPVDHSQQHANHSLAWDSESEQRLSEPGLAEGPPVVNVTTYSSASCSDVPASCLKTSAPQMSPDFDKIQLDNLNKPVMAFSSSVGPLLAWTQLDDELLIALRRHDVGWDRIADGYFHGRTPLECATRHDHLLPGSGLSSQPSKSVSLGRNKNQEREWRPRWVIGSNRDAPSDTSSKSTFLFNANARQATDVPRKPSPQPLSVSGNVDSGGLHGSTSPPSGFPGEQSTRPDDPNLWLSLADLFAAKNGQYISVGQESVKLAKFYFMSKFSVSGKILVMRTRISNSTHSIMSTRLTRAFGWVNIPEISFLVDTVTTTALLPSIHIPVSVGDSPGCDADFVLGRLDIGRILTTLSPMHIHQPSAQGRAPSTPSSQVPSLRSWVSGPAPEATYFPVCSPMSSPHPHGNYAQDDYVSGSYDIDMGHLDSLCESQKPHAMFPPGLQGPNIGTYSHPVSTSTLKSPSTSIISHSSRPSTPSSDSSPAATHPSSIEPGPDLGELSDEEGSSEAILVRVVLRELKQRFHSCLNRAWWTHPSDGASGHDASQRPAPATGQDGNSGEGSECSRSSKSRSILRQSQPPGKRRANRGWDSDEDDVGGSDGNDRPMKKRRKSADLRQRRLSCPFHKRNGPKYARSPACAGPGFLTVHRLKEHLMRTHIQKPFCGRCNRVFDTPSTLRKHYKSPAPCTVTLSGLLPEGISPDQRAALSSRRRPGLPEEASWLDLYKILFPDDDHSVLPTPYHGDGVYGPYAQTGPENTAEDFVRFAHREGPALLRHEIESDEGPLTSINDDLRTRIPEMFDRVIDRLHAVYRRGHDQICEPDGQDDEEQPKNTRESDEIRPIARFPETSGRVQQDVADDEQPPHTVLPASCDIFPWQPSGRDISTPAGCDFAGGVHFSNPIWGEPSGAVGNDPLLSFLPSIRSEFRSDDAVAPWDFDLDAMAKKCLEKAASKNEAYHRCELINDETEEWY